MVKKKFTLALFPLALCFSSAHVLAAATVADLEQRLAEQEKQILRLNNTLKGTRAAVKEDRSRIQEIQERLKINGFLSAGVATNDGDAVEETFYGISDNYSTAAINKLGVQMTFEVADNISATAQMVSKGSKGYGLEAEWAYLTYEATNDLRFNLGRQRTPYYLLSEYLDVGYALPWVMPPIEMYNIPISSVDGLSAIYGFNLGDMNFTWQTYAGAGGGYSDQLDAEFTQNQAWGTNLLAEWNSWSFRLGYTTSRLDADPTQGGSGAQLVDALNTARDTLGPTLGVALPAGSEWLGGTENIVTDYISAGFMYDDGKLLVLGELANLSVDDTFQPVGDAGYLTVGYRFGKWMPHVTFSKFQTDSKNDKQIRQAQEYADMIGAAAYQSALAYNGIINGVVTVTPPGVSLTTAGFPSSRVLSSSACASPLVPGSPDFGCTLQSLALMSGRDQLLAAASGYGESLHNALESQIQEQQSYTLGLTYDVSSRVKAKAQVTHFEGFGSGNYQTLDSTAINSVITQYNGLTPVSADGNGRFSGEPGAAGNHTAIYSLSVDAVF